MEVAEVSKCKAFVEESNDELGNNEICLEAALKIGRHGLVRL